MAELPRGTVTFLFTDIEGSTALWERDRAAMQAAVDRHLSLLRAAIDAHSGVLFKIVGDGTQSAFASAPAALAAALTTQQALGTEPWPESIGPLAVRMALHAGEAQPRDGDYLAAPLNRLARLLVAGHGGQILLTQAVQQLVRDGLPTNVRLRTLGTHHLRDLHEPEVVFQVVAPGLPAQFPPLQTLPSHPTNLPAPPTTLLGRDEEVSRILRLLDDGVRLLTLTGPGGIGKTRLAQDVAAEALARWPDGVFFVDLAPIRDPHAVLPTMATVLGVREGLGEPVREALGRFLAERRMLLVLDNCEQVLEAGPDLAALLAACPQLQLLATSREPLRLRAERVFPVAPLPLPDLQHLPELAALAQIPSVALFVERAQATVPAFTLSAANARAIAAICRRLDGLPLAIELAAARVKVLPPDRLLARLDQALPLLTGGARDAPERQRTLRDAIAWSHELLSPEEQRLFRALGVFVGGWTLEGAETVAAEDGRDVLEGLTSLSDKSLIRLDGGGPEPRYRMLETIREYAADQLARSPDAAAVRRAHLVSVVQLAQANDIDDQGPGFEERLARLTADEANLWAALEWALRHDPASALLLAVSVMQLASLHGRLASGLDVAERVLATAAGPDHPERARVLYLASWLAMNLAEYPRAEVLAAAAFALAERLGAARHAAYARYCQGSIALSQGGGEHATALLTDALTRFERVGEIWGMVDCLSDLGLVAMDRGDATAAIASFERCLVLATDHQAEDRTRASHLNNLGGAYRCRGEHLQAQDLSTQALALAERVGSAYQMAKSREHLSRLALDRGERVRAAQLLGESPRLWWESGDRWSLVGALDLAAAIMSAQPYAEGAARLHGAIETLRAAIALPIGACDRDDHERSLAAAHAALEESAFERAQAEGRRMPLATAVAEAVTVLAMIAAH